VGLQDRASASRRQSGVFQSKETVMYNIPSGLVSLTHQLESDLQSIREQIRKVNSEWR
jgi:hypothetical protein